MMRSVADWIDTAPADDQADYHGNLGAILDNVGQGREAEAHHLRAIAISRSLSLWGSAASGLGNLAHNRLNAGNVDGAIAALQEAEQLWALYETSFSAPVGITLTLSTCARIQGRYGDALTRAHAAIDRCADPRPANPWVANARTREAEIWIDLGQYARARQAIDRAPIGDTPDFSHVANLASLRALMLRLVGEPSEDAVAFALSALPDGARPDLRHRLLLERVVCAAPLQALAMTEEVAEDARRIGHDGTIMAALARRAGSLWKHDAGVAVAAARRALEMAESLDAWFMYKPEIWYNAALAFRAAGLDRETRAALGRASDWILQRVQHQHVPEPFTDSFLHRNPINREVFSLLGCAPR